MVHGKVSSISGNCTTNVYIEEEGKSSIGNLNPTSRTGIKNNKIHSTQQ